MTHETQDEAFFIHIDNQKFSVERSIISGLELLDIVDKKPRESIIYQLLATGEMEHIRPNETVDLRSPGVEKFLTFETDRIFRFELNQIGLEWGAPKITGKALKKLSKVEPEKYDLFQLLKDGTQASIEDGKIVNLSEKGVEVFFTRPAKRFVTVYYGENEFEIEKGEYSTEDLCRIFEVSDGYILQLIVDGDFITLQPGQKIKIKKGMKFISHAPVGASS